MKKIILLFVVILISGICIGQSGTYATIETQNAVRYEIVSAEFSHPADDSTFQAIRPIDDNGKVRPYTLFEALEMIEKVGFKCFAVYHDDPKIVYLCRRKVD